MAVYLYITGGKFNYETLSANFGVALPTPSIVMSASRSYLSPILEGTIRMAECMAALEERKQPRTVWVSEDATGINGRVEYDSKTDRCVGFVGPLDERGMPDLSRFGAEDADTIQGLFARHATARSAHLVLAQPLEKHAAPLWLLLFGTDNKYPKEAVLSRWRHLKARASEKGIRILGFSSDGGKFST